MILGLAKPVTKEKVKNAHRDLMLVNHPDRGGRKEHDLLSLGNIAKEKRGKETEEKNMNASC